ncbi:MAG: hypothetical protein HRU15_02525, partial [Planctomycetes bacterium]|nr:hypothetical protein [Planctomycetota bacterium]
MSILHTSLKVSIGAICALSLLCLSYSSLSAAGTDPYVDYIKTSKDFKAVKQDKEWAYKAWPSWTYMPWYFQWGIGHGDAGGKFSKDMGYNGAFTNGNDNSYLDWINKNKLRFYNDHTAGKGDLLIRHKSDAEVKYIKEKVPGTGMRKSNINDALYKKLTGLMKKNIGAFKSSPYRSAYALDDEISWGSFVKPCMWRVTDDGPYRTWLKEIYGAGNAPKNPGWISYNNLRKTLDNSKLKD